MGILIPVIVKGLNTNFNHRAEREGRREGNARKNVDSRWGIKCRVINLYTGSGVRDVFLYASMKTVWYLVKCRYATRNLHTHVELVTLVSESNDRLLFSSYIFNVLSNRFVYFDRY